MQWCPTAESPGLRHDRRIPWIYITAYANHTKRPRQRTKNKYAINPRRSKPLDLLRRFRYRHPISPTPPTQVEPTRNRATNRTSASVRSLPKGWHSSIMTLDASNVPTTSSGSAKGRSIAKEWFLMILEYHLHAG